MSTGELFLASQHPQRWAQSQAHAFPKHEPAEVAMQGRKERSVWGGRLEAAGPGGGLGHHSAPAVLARRGTGEGEINAINCPASWPPGCKGSRGSISPRSSWLLLPQCRATDTAAPSKVPDDLVPHFVSRGLSACLQPAGDFPLQL